MKSMNWWTPWIFKLQIKHHSNFAIKLDLRICPGKSVLWIRPLPSVMECESSVAGSLFLYNPLFVAFVSLLSRYFVCPGNHSFPLLGCLYGTLLWNKLCDFCRKTHSYNMYQYAKHHNILLCLSNVIISGGSGRFDRDVTGGVVMAGNTEHEISE